MFNYFKQMFGFVFGTRSPVGEVAPYKIEAPLPSTEILPAHKVATPEPAPAWIKFPKSADAEIVAKSEKKSVAKKPAKAKSVGRPRKSPDAKK